jgi:anti-sigma B factor antagonist
MADGSDHPTAGRGTPFHLTVDRVDTGVVIVVTGEVDLSTGPLVLRAARSVLAEPVTSLAIDLAGVTFIDSSGIDVLVTIRDEASASAIPFTLAFISPPVRRVLEIVNLLDLLGPNRP